MILKGGIVLSMDPDVGDLPSGDVLIEGTQILDIGQDLGRDGMVIDCNGCMGLDPG